MSLELDLIRVCNPFPSVTKEGELRDGLCFCQPKICSRCAARECREYCGRSSRDGIEHFVCPGGMSVFVVPFSSGKVVSNGLIEMFLNRECNASLRKRCRSQKVSMQAVDKWWNSAKHLGVVAHAMLDERVNESIESLHDIGTSVRLVRSFANRMIQQYPGRSDEENIESAPDEMKALYKSVLLLGRRLEMSSIIANPEAAAFGQKRPTPVYKVFDLICRLFQEVAHWDASKHIYICGSSFNTPQAYNSFESLALVLIDNAVKYCEKRGTVSVVVNDVGHGVTVSVENQGELVPDQYRKQIFEKGFRTPFATQFHSAGRGFGLYIASVIAQVHGFELEYLPLKKDPSHGPNYGINAFRFTVTD